MPYSAYKSLTIDQIAARVEKAYDQEGALLNQIMEVVSQFKASVRSFNVNENARNGTAEISMKISVPSNLELDKVVSQIRTLKHVVKVTRV